MGEYVESGLEELVPVLEECVRLRLFERAEVAKVVGRCRSLEYALQKRLKRPQDFAAYAAYLSDLRDLVHARRKRLKVWDEKAKVDKGLAVKLGSVLGRGCERFPANRQLWDARLDLAKRGADGHNVSKLYFRLLQLQPSRLDVWEEAIGWELAVNGSLENARSLAQRALRQTPKALRLWKAFLRLELRVVHNLLQRRELLLKKPQGDELKEEEEEQKDQEKVEEDDEAGPNQTKKPKEDPEEEEEEKSLEELMTIVLIVFANAVDSVPSSSEDAGLVAAELLGVMREFPFATEAAKELLEERAAQTPDSAALAEARVLAAVARHDARAADETLILDAGDYEARRRRDRFLLGLELFGDAVESAVSPALAAALSAATFRFALQSLKDQAGTDTPDAILQEMVDRTEALLEGVGHDAASARAFAETLVQLGLTTQALSVLSTSISLTPDSAELWLLFLSLVAKDATEKKRKDLRALKKLFNQAVKQVSGSSALPIWELGLATFAKLEPECLEVVLKASQTGSVDGSVRSALKVAYVRWAAANLTSKSAHGLFLELAGDKPAPLGLYTAYAQALGPKAAKGSQDAVERRRKAFELGLVEHGQDSPPLWMAALKAEAETGQGDRVAQLHARAARSLKPQHLPTLAQQWTIYKTSGETEQ